MSATPSLFFYDLETSGIRPDSARIMQFAGQRVDLDLNPIEKPIDHLIRLSEDILPDPEAVLVHGIAPQQTVLEGLSEAEFLEVFYRDVIKPETTFVGYNNVRFDDEFMRYLNYRNLFDPYAWAWEKHNSRWDLLDVVRITRALRPEGINWPIDENGKNSNRLGSLTQANSLSHKSAHDALSDVLATIELARLIKQKQPKLFDYLFSMRLKEEVAMLVNSKQPFIYTSSHYPAINLHTTLVVKVADNLPSPNSILVYDLRYDPEPWLELNEEQLADAWRYDPKRRLTDSQILPVKTLRFNRCPAIAPLDTLRNDVGSADRINLDYDTVELNLKKLQSDKAKTFAERLNLALAILNNEQAERRSAKKPNLDARLYDGFYSNQDRDLMHTLHEPGESAERIRDIRGKFSDTRLKQLCSLYLARNYKRDLNPNERQGWQDYLKRQMFDGGQGSRLAEYFSKIAELAQERADARSQVLLEDLKLYGESLVPLSYADDEE